ncbi:hypothetical protein TNCV_3480971 [Trichonephila clavipes]|nr:hypothetical protein TNCV_3480971 [Trichonephila clavipes]
MILTSSSDSKLLCNQAMGQLCLRLQPSDGNLSIYEIEDPNNFNCQMLFSNIITEELDSSNFMPTGNHDETMMPVVHV